MKDVDYIDYDSIDEYLEDHDGQEYSDKDWGELLDWFGEALEEPEPDDYSEYDEAYEPSSEYDPTEDYDIDYWEQISEEYEGYDQEFAEYEKFS